MGMSYIFKCDQCDYNVESTGELSEGMRAVVSPYICNDCKIITDVMVGMYGSMYIKEWFENPKESPLPDFTIDMKDEFFTCGECKGENLTDWDSKIYECPKCDGKMFKDNNEPPLLWD